MSLSLMIVEDDEWMRSFLATVLREEGYSVTEAGDGEEGLRQIRERGYDLVITDLRLPKISGLDLMNKGKKDRPETLWIIITAYGSIGNAVEAMKAGASDYLTKPLRDPNELRHVVRRVLKEAEAERTISLLTEELGRHYPPPGMIFLGERMQEVQRLVEEVASTTASVLLTGASGTGKELVARMIHQLSPRRNRPFIAVHCAALTETLLESELFGHERGSFTGAVTARKGRFELADGGTILLDEVGEVPATVQVKLLRVLQEREFERVGGTRSIAVDIRLISATHKDLKAEVSAGKFREDLLYRLNVFPIALPSLVERREAILPLAEFFLKRFASSLNKRINGFIPEAQSALLQYHWPGNIRELQNVIERAVILSRKEIELQHLNIPISPGPAPGEKGLLQENERATIQRVLTEVRGNRKRAAQILGISLRTLQYRLKEYGL